jgi:hypothetical protein
MIGETLRGSSMPVLADTQQTDEMVDGHVPILELAGQVGLGELRDGHTNRSLSFALQVRVVLLVGEFDDRRPGDCLSNLHDPRVAPLACAVRGFGGRRDPKSGATTPRPGRNPAAPAIPRRQRAGPFAKRGFRPPLDVRRHGYPYCAVTAQVPV